MNAIEVKGKIDKAGNLLLKKTLSVKDKKVKVIILYEEAEEYEEDKLWLKNMANNPSFSFLQDEPDIYSLTDGKPFNG